MKRIISFIFSLIIIISPLVQNADIALCEERETYYAQYSGNAHSTWGMTPHCVFTINNIVGDKFRGTFAVSNIGNYSFNNAVEGSVYGSDSDFTCVFHVDFAQSYHSDVVITIYPLAGSAECFCVGSWHMEDFTMYGTVFDFGGNQGISNSDYYDEDDMKMCMEVLE